MKKYKFALIAISSLILASCNKHLYLINKENVVHKTRGIFVFIDGESRKFRNTGSDIFNDSLIRDFFIPYNFPANRIITQQNIESAFQLKNIQDIFFFYIKDDCKTNGKSICINLSTQFFLDRNIDDYLHSNKLFVLPVEIEYFKVKDNLGTDYYRIHKRENLPISYKNKNLTFILHSDYYDVLKFKVLESQ